ncbi:MAG: hypothetical protein R2932_56610 [Caldilineaceae bacterium]
MSKKRSKSAQAKSPQANPVQAKSDRTKATPKATHRPGAGCAIAAVGLILVLLAGAAVGTPWLLTVLANGAETPTLTAGAAHELLVEQQRQAKTQLESYGWVDKEAAVAHVPIERAITMLANSELPVGVAAAIPPTAPPAAADLTNVNYTDNILPIFQQHCAECHGNDDPEEGSPSPTTKRPWPARSMAR